MPESAWQRELQFAARPQSSADLIRNGIGRGEFRGPTWRRVRRGFYVPESAGHAPGQRRLTTAQRILDLAPLLTGRAALGTWAAAYVLGIDWLDGLDPDTMVELPVDIIAADRRRRQPKTLNYRFTELDAGEVTVRDGLPISSACRTAFDGARWAGSLEESVVFVDAMLAFDRLESLTFKSYICDHTGWPAVQRAARAAELARANVKSPWETRLRLCWLLEAKLPEPLINVAIFDRRGDLLGVADLFDPDSGLVAEFDGGQHRDAEQHRRDNIREEKLESANLTVVRSDNVDIRQERRKLVGRLRDGYRRGQHRDRSQDRWTLSQPDWWLRRQRS